MTTKVFFTHRVSGAPTEDPNGKFYDAIATAIEECPTVLLEKKKKKKKAGMLPPSQQAMFSK